MLKYCYIFFLLTTLFGCQLLFNKVEKTAINFPKITFSEKFELLEAFKND